MKKIKFQTIFFIMIILFINLLVGLNAAVYKGIYIPDTEPYAISDILTSKQVESAKSNFIEGFKLYNSKNYLSAIDRFEKSIEFFPYANEAFYWLAQTHYMLGDYPASVEVLKKIPKQTKFIMRRIGYLASDKDLQLYNDYFEKFEIKKASIIKSANYDDKRFISPLNIAAKDNLIFVISALDKALLVIDKEYNLKNKYKQFQQPSGLELNNDKLYVSDFKENAIYIFSADEQLKLLKKIEIKDKEYSAKGINNLTIGERENIYFSDASSNSVLKIDEDGKILFKIDNYAKRYFRSVTDLKWYVNSLYVLDGANFKILQFDEVGNKLGEINIDKKYITKPASLNIFNDNIVITDAQEGTNNNKFAIYSMESGEFVGYILDIGKRANIVNSLIVDTTTEFLYDSNNNELLKKENDNLSAKYTFDKERIIDIAYNKDKVYALIFPGNRIFEFSKNLQKTNELKISIFDNKEIESFEIYDDKFVIKYANSALPILLFRLNGEPVNLELEDKNLCAYFQEDNLEVKTHYTQEKVYKVNLIDTVFISVKYITSNGKQLAILDDFNNKIYMYDVSGKFQNTIDIPLEYSAKKIKLFNQKLCIYAGKNNIQPLVYNLEIKDYEPVTPLPDKPLVSGACYRIALNAIDNSYYYADFENNTITNIAYYEKIKEQYILNIKNIDYTSMFPHIITNISVRDANYNKVYNLNENFFEIFEGYNDHEAVETLGMHNYSVYDNSDSVLEFRKNFMVMPVSVKPFERYTNLHNIAILIENTEQLQSDYRLVRNFINELVNNLNYSKYKVDLWVLMNGIPENLIANTTDKFEVMRLVDRSKNVISSELDFIDFIEKSASSVALYKNLKTIIYITSSDKTGELELTPRVKKLIRFLRNNDIHIEFVNFNRNKDAIKQKFSEYFSNRYMQFPDVSTKKILDYIDNYKSGNYTIFYRNKARKPAYNYINQYINLKYKGTRGETRSGYFIP